MYGEEATGITQRDERNCQIYKNPADEAAVMKMRLESHRHSLERFSLAHAGSVDEAHHATLHCTLSWR
jgi:hypothetical protein